MRRAIHENSLLNINICNCEYYSAKSFFQNLDGNGVTSLWMNLLLNINIIVSIVQQNFPCKIYIQSLFAFKCNCNYCSAKFVVTKKKNPIQNLVGQIAAASMFAGLDIFLEW